jgi:hypothetical protein
MDVESIPENDTNHVLSTTKKRTRVLDKFDTPKETSNGSNQPWFFSKSKKLLSLFSIKPVKKNHGSNQPLKNHGSNQPLSSEDVRSLKTLCSDSKENSPQSIYNCFIDSDEIAGFLPPIVYEIEMGNKEAISNLIQINLASSRVSHDTLSETKLPSVDTLNKFTNTIQAESHTESNATLPDTCKNTQTRLNQLPNMVGIDISDSENPLVNKAVQTNEIELKKDILISNIMIQADALDIFKTDQSTDSNDLEYQDNSLVKENLKLKQELEAMKRMVSVTAFKNQ